MTRHQTHNIAFKHSLKVLVSVGAVFSEPQLNAAGVEEAWPAASTKIVFLVAPVNAQD